MDERYTVSSRVVSGEPTERDLAWVRATRHAFAQDRGTDDVLRRVWNHAVADGQTWRRIDREPVTAGLLDPDLPVATFGHLVGQVNVGAGRFSSCIYVLDVTVRATDRRHGLLRTMMTDALTEARDQGIPLAGLTASEGSIYGRFGFGVAIRDESIEVQCTDQFQLIAPPALVVEQSEPRHHVELTLQLMDEFHARHRGSHRRLDYHRDLFGGLWDFWANAEPLRLRSLVALDGGRPVGVLIHEPDGQGSTKVVMVIADGAAELALWQQLARTDLVRKATFAQHMPASPLQSALVDPRVIRATVGDWLWLRIIDVAQAFEQRGFDHDGQVVLHVDDPMGLSSGSWRITVVDGRAAAEPTDPSTPGLACRVDALAPCWFGDTSVEKLARAGRFTGDSDQVREFSRLMSVDEGPRNLVAF